MTSAYPSATRYDWYRILGVPRDVGDADLRRAYRQCALKTHPDKGGTAEAFQLVLAAFEALSELSQRCLPTVDRADCRQDRKRRQSGTNSGPCHTGSVPKEKQARGAQSSQDGGAGVPNTQCGAERPTSGPPQSTASSSRGSEAPGEKPASQPDSKCGTYNVGETKSCTLEDLLEMTLEGARACLASISDADLESLEAELAQKILENPPSATATSPKQHAKQSGQQQAVVQSSSDSESSSEEGTECAQAQVFLALRDGAVLALEDDDASASKPGDGPAPSSPGMDGRQTSQAERRAQRMHRGVRKTKAKTGYSYTTFVGVDNLGIVTQAIHTLETVLEAHISLVQAKRRLQEMMRCGMTFARAAEEALAEMARSRAADGQVELRLSFVVDRGGNSVRIVTPTTQVLATALDFHRQVFDAFEGAVDGESDELRQHFEVLRAEMLARVKQEREARKPKKPSKRPAKRRAPKSKLPAKLRSLLRLAQVERRQRARRLRRLFGVSALPRGIVGIMLEDKPYFHVQRRCGTDDYINGPLRKALREASADLKELETVVAESGIQPAKEAAARMDVDAMTALFLQGQGL
mmetsp:Transcript_45750/g.132475  ORF Transcript_45750/g.132475 Transcript_45750/m.132475 type:complete len:582 (-) Transcript_45750:143-1888(-)